MPFPAFAKRTTQIPERLRPHNRNVSTEGEPCIQLREVESLFQAGRRVRQRLQLLVGCFQVLPPVALAQLALRVHLQDAGGRS